MTEEEAKTKACCGPPSLCHATLIASGLTMEGPVDPGRCIASACMAWRWSRAKDTEGFLALVRERVKTGENYNKALSSALVEHRETYERTEGFCGLAGGGDQ